MQGQRLGLGLSLDCWFGFGGCFRVREGTQGQGRLGCGPWRFLRALQRRRPGA